MKVDYDAVFVTRSLHGGGAEKVISQLVNALAGDGKKVLLIHLYNSASYFEGTVDSRIEVISLEDHINGSLASNSGSKDFITRVWGLFYRYVIKTNIYISKLRDTLFCKIVGQESAEEDFKNLETSIRSYLQFAKSLDLILEDKKTHSKLVAVMEEASIVVWLSQIYSSRPYVCSLHTVESLYLPTIWGGKEWASRNFLFSSACKSSAKVIFPSKGSADDLMRMYSLEKNLMAVIPNPIDLAGCVELASSSSTLSIPEGRIIFCHIARLDSSKDHQLLISASKLLKNKLPNFLIYLIGSGPEEESIRKMIVESGLENNMILLGHLNNPFPVLKRSRALVLTSKFESFALVLLEAMALSVVPVSVDCENGPREVLDFGRCGVLIKERNPKDLAESMYLAATDDEVRSILLENAKSHVENYNLPLIAKKWFTLMEEV